MEFQNIKTVLETVLTSFSTCEGKKGIRKQILSSLLKMRRVQLLKMIDFSIDENSLIVDMGCSVGYLTRPLFLRSKTLGLDVDKEKLHWAKKSNRQIEFICCDLCYLPLKESSVSIAVCASVFEHIENLEYALKDILFVLKKRGKIAGGYPIETKLLEFIIKSFWKLESHVWDQSNISKNKDRLKNPHVHKRDFSDIRKILGKDFLLMNRQKIPTNWTPDFFSIYENVLLVENGNKFKY